MDNVNGIVEQYLAAWNESDAMRRQDLIARTWTEDGSYIDPLTQGEGHGGINTMVQNAQAQFADLRFRRIGKVDVHHDRVRFSWELAPGDGPAIAAGTDFATLASDGRFEAVIGFLDYAPAASAD